MSQQTYPVKCGCGKVHQCPAGYAGTRFACPCGKAVEVPVLSKLRAAAGEAVLSPDVEIPTLMAARALPLEDDCALCGCATTETLMLLATCERPSIKAKPVFWVGMFFLLFAPIGILLRLILTVAGLRNAASEEPTGRDVQLRFPLRMCQSCASEVSSWDVIRDAMRRTPVYARLLDKYPACQLATVKPL